ncbi:MULTISPECIES: AraC family transcriptional regulator [unclassified Rhodococcus (in: high G+C Gram-positive bacteria)]|uniref:AraC family transcriptional regulator n=1 Tax=unclassified Rhodococcus (in: high G+C Gram-positive bacteria) TaxID=192944 RepID=UPI00163AA5F8|nr:MULTISPECIES: AraC family transcriptional regulator [unclassified Rhodococcus (in: high G+C Gram-positive bacteria)]MBC2637867.1 AraC family transcriptional regulator [Rhodococcus sp. 3A]MBC2897385.1 AraC family transcriptional regulator [Rhodococcus sp. 4CII]
MPDHWRGPEQTVPAATRHGAPPCTSINLHSEDVEEAVAGVGEVFHPHELTRVGAAGGFHADLKAVVAGSMVTGQLRYNNNTDLYCPSIDGYHVNIPMSGRLLSESVGEQTTVEQGNAVVYSTGADARILTPRTSQLHVFAMKLDRSTMQIAIQDLLDRPVSQPVQLHGGVDLTTVNGHAWRRLVLDTYRSQIEGTFMANPLLAAPLTYSIAVGLLNLTGHQYADELSRPALRSAPAPINEAVEFINAHTAMPLSPELVARKVGLGVRALQRGFRDHLDTTPIEFIRNARMKRAHEDLMHADAEVDTVSGIASRWGFYHYGRFSHEYRRIYGVSPSQTLRS